MIARYWHDDPSFCRLCDLVAGDRLVCVTGAGISSRLPQKADHTKRVPQWPALLETLFSKFEKRLSSQEREDCFRLLRLDPRVKGTEWPSGRDLILAASILRTASPMEFDTIFRSEVTNADATFSDIHSILLDLQPAGILTFNYDSGHENAALVRNTTLSAMVPSEETALRQALASRLRPFYLKAHGSLDTASELVLTEESYREIIVKAPTYRSFVQNVLTNFNLLFTGFRISDPDFDLFIDTMAHQFGSPLHEHVAVFHESERSVNDIALRRRYGIHVIYVRDFCDIPDMLRDALTIPGPQLSTHLVMAMSAARDERDKAHRHFDTLGPAGRLCASNALKGRIAEFSASVDHFRMSELAYSLGTIDPRGNKEVLMHLVDTAAHADPAGRALTVLRPVLEMSDLPQLQAWLKRFSDSPLPGAHTDRIPKYLDYLLTYIPAKFRS